MQNLTTFFFGPLTKNACIYFYFLTLLFFFLLVLTIMGGIIFIIKKRKELTFKLAIQGISIACNVFLLYFVNRLLHTMCVRSLI